MARVIDSEPDETNIACFDGRIRSDFERMNSVTENKQANGPNVGLSNGSNTQPPVFTMEQKRLVLEMWHFVTEHYWEVKIVEMDLVYFNMFSVLFMYSTTQSPFRFRLDL